MTKDKALFILDEMPEWNNDLRYSEEEYKEVIELCRALLLASGEEKETDLISREEAKARYKEKFVDSLVDEERNIDFSEYAEMPCERFNEFIDSIPSAVPEREKGEWVHARVGRLFPSNDYKCSICGNVLNFDGVNCGRGDANFCPNCGANMKGV